MARPPDVDLIIAFTATRKTSLSKQQTREDAKKAEQQYKRLIDSLTYAGLKAVGRRGESLGHILIFVTCPPSHVEELVKREKHSDFLSGLPVTPAPHVLPLSPADRIRLVHSYITSTPADGGLGISPEAPDWDLVDSIFPLHDHSFNELWVRAWKPRNIASVQLERIRDQFGDSLALYFGFLASYTKFLIVPAVFGLFAHFFLPPYSPIYSFFLSIWSIIFVEWWRVREGLLSLRFGTRGSFKVEKRRAQHKQGISWWAKELRVLASVPVIFMWAAFLTAILTGIFVFEAFVSHLYQGPGQKLIAFSPTLLFVVLVPRVLAVYHAVAVRLTNWENHAHKSTYTASLTLKVFALSSIVAYLGLGLSAFVYVPFGEGVMRTVQAWLFGGASPQGGSFGAVLQEILNGTFTAAVDVKPEPLSAEETITGTAFWDTDTANVRAKLNPARLKDQMFAFTVTNQIVGTFLEVGLPFILRWVADRKKVKAKSASPSSSSTNVSSGASDSGSTNGGPRKRVVFEDEKERGGLEERAYLDLVRKEAALPEYDLFADYSEMVVQFGYVTLWSTIWPLAGVMALLNNLLELRSDAFKMTVHFRRPVPVRTDTIGPWLDALAFLTWLGALTNAALVYLFSPQLLPFTPSPFLASNTVSESSVSGNETNLLMEEHLVTAAGGLAPGGGWGVDGTSSPATLNATKELLLKAALVALLASHGYILLRLVIRHIVDRVCWRTSKEVEERDREIRRAREGELRGNSNASLLVDKVSIEREVIATGKGNHPREVETGEQKDEMEFWDHDEGIEEIRRISKEA